MGREGVGGYTWKKGIVLGEFPGWLVGLNDLYSEGRSQFMLCGTAKIKIKMSQT